jgi:hypothetical protein
MVWHGGKGHHPRGSSQSSYCIKDCANRDKCCDDCYKYDMFVDNKEVESGD